MRLSLRDPRFVEARTILFCELCLKREGAFILSENNVLYCEVCAERAHEAIWLRSDAGEPSEGSGRAGTYRSGSA